MAYGHNIQQHLANKKTINPIDFRPRPSRTVKPSMEYFHSIQLANESICQVGYKAPCIMHSFCEYC